MRAAFAMELAGIEQRIDRELRRAAATLTVIADACTDPTAERVELISEHGRLLRQASHSHDAELLAVTARQTPVAGDLRLVLALIQLAHYEGLIANQFELISQQLIEVDAAVRDRQGTGEKLSSMSTLAGAQLRSAAAAFAARDLAVAQRIDRDDDAIDKGGIERLLQQETLRCGWSSGRGSCWPRLDRATRISTRRTPDARHALGIRGERSASPSLLAFCKALR